MADNEPGTEAAGEDFLRGEFHGQTAQIRWHDLQPHYARGAVVLVGEGLDLVEVAMELKRDNAESFQQWIDSGRVSGISDEQGLAFFEANPLLWAVVVPPWVLVQETR